MVHNSVFYKGLKAQQHPEAFNVFLNFLNQIKPARILEIGTAGGGFTLFVRDALNALGLATTTYKSFDIEEQDSYSLLRQNNVEVNIENIFDSDYQNIEKYSHVEPFIQEEGATLVLCDGGNKITEFNTIAPLLKPQDFIMAHDYVESYAVFKEKFFSKIWNWCEIQESHIEQTSKECGLVPYGQNSFAPVVWVCKQKV